MIVTVALVLLGRAAAVEIPSGDLASPNEVVSLSAPTETVRVHREWVLDGVTHHMDIDVRMDDLRARNAEWGRVLAHYSVSELEGGVYTYDRSRCAVELESCLFRDALRVGSRDMRLIVDEFRRRSKEQGWDRRQLARHVLAFVGHLPYRNVRHIPSGVLGPSLTVYLGGDCDSKAYLAVAMLEALDVRAIVVEPAGLPHALVAVDLPRGPDDASYRFGDETWLPHEISVGGHQLGVLPEPLRTRKVSRRIPASGPSPVDG